MCCIATTDLGMDIDLQHIHVRSDTNPVHSDLCILEHLGNNTVAFVLQVRRSFDLCCDALQSASRWGKVQPTSTIM